MDKKRGGYLCFCKEAFLFCASFFSDQFFKEEELLLIYLQNMLRNNLA